MVVVLRFISLILIVIGLMLLGADFVTTLERHGPPVVRSVGQVWAILDRNGLASAEAWARQTLPNPLMSAFMTLLGTWSWVVVGIPGIVMAFIFDRRQPERA